MFNFCALFFMLALVWGCYFAIESSEKREQLQADFDTRLSTQTEQYESKLVVLSTQLDKTDAKLQKVTKQYKSLQKTAREQEATIARLEGDLQISEQQTVEQTGTTPAKTIVEQPEAKAANAQPVSTQGGTYIGDFTITYYCGENYPHICGTGNGVTASGATAITGVTIAADPNVLPIGTTVYIEGIGERTVQDTGGAIVGNRIDVFVNTHSEALENGIHTAKVYQT